MRLGGGATAYLAKPSRAPQRGIVILPSMWGTTPAFEQIAERLASDEGWAVCIPEIVVDDMDFETRRSTVVTLVDDDIFSILKEAAAATEAPEVALIGFCIGGMYAMKATSLNLFDRVVDFYGMVHIPEYWQSPGQGEPLDYLRGNTDRILGVYGEQDEFIPVAHIDTLEDAGVPVVRYSAAGHAFAHDGPHYRADDAEDAWRRAIAFITSGQADTQ